MGQGHIKLDGEWYTIDLRSRQKKDIIDFSPRAAEAGNPVHSELGLYQTLNFDSWQGGFGAPWHTATKTNMYMYTIGQVDTRHSGIAMLYTDPVTVTSTIEVDGAAGFKGDIYLYSSDGITKHTSSDGLTSATLVNTDHSVGLWNNGYYIFSCRLNDTLIYAGTDVTASSDWTETGFDTDQKAFSWLTSHDGYVYGGQFSGSDGSSGHYVSYDDSLDLSDIYTVSSDDTQMIPVGLNGMQTKKGIPYRGDLLIPRPDGIYKMDKDRGAARRVLDYSDVPSCDNFRSIIEYNGQLVYPIRDTLKQWNGVREVPINPPFMNDSFPYRTYGRFDNFVVVGRFLFMTARTNDSTYEEHLLCFDNVAWHKLAELVTDGAKTVSALFYDPVNDRLWYAIKASGVINDTIGYFPFQHRSEFPYARFDYLSENSIVFPRIAAGFKEVVKSTPSCLITGDNCSTGYSLGLYYSLDASTTWLPWGGSTEANILSSDGTKKFINPTGMDHSTLEYEYINFKIRFNAATSTDTPVLEGFYPRLLVRPDTLYGWSFTLQASASAQYGTKQSFKVAKEILNHLKAIRDSKSPVQFIDIYDDEYYVYITSITENSIEEHVDRPGLIDIEARVMINLVQVG